MSWYFAYGCNMNIGHLRSFLLASGVSPAGACEPKHALLRDFHIRTNFFSESHGCGVCTIEPFPGGTVEGAVMEITPAVRDALRSKEGWPDVYTEAEVSVSVIETGRETTALTYFARPEHRGERDLRAGSAYATLVDQGATQCGLSFEYRNRLKEILRGSDGD